MEIQRKYLEYSMREKIIGRIEDFPEGKGTEVRLGGLKMAVFNIDGELYAIHDS